MMKGCQLLSLFFFFLLNILLRILKQEKAFFGLHFSADIAAIKGTVPFFLILLRLKP